MNMAMRNQSLQEFLNAAQTAYLSRASDSNSVRSLNQIFAALETPAPQSNAASGRIPVCHYLDEIAAHTNSFPADLQLTMEKFSAIEPALQWRPRQGDCTGASENFWENHANAMVVGPNGLETREDVWLRVSLVGPNVRYPDHQHPPKKPILSSVLATFDSSGKNGFMLERAKPSTIRPTSCTRCDHLISRYSSFGP